MSPSALAIQGDRLLPNSPSGLLAYEDSDSQITREIQATWKQLFSQGEIHSRSFTFAKGNKEHEWICKVYCPKITEAALKIFLGELAARPGVTWITFSSQAFDDRKVAFATRACNELPDLKVIYWEGPFSTSGSTAIMNSLKDAKAPLEVIFMHGYPTPLWGVGEAYRESKVKLPSPAALVERDEGELLAERLIQETSISETEEELTKIWRTLFEQESIRGEHFYWERLDQEDGAVVACRISSRTLNPTVLASLIPFLVEGISTLTLSVDFVDKEKMELIAHAIAHFKGGLHLTLRGDFSDREGEKLAHALDNSPSVIQGLTVQGNYSWDMVERLLEIGLKRVVTKKPQIMIPAALKSFAFKDRYEQFLKKRAVLFSS